VTDKAIERHWPFAALRALGLLAVTLLVMNWRRGDQLRRPYVWVEDGTVCLPDYIQSGWWSVLHPVAGYFSLPIKAFHALAVTLSFRWLPEIGAALAVGFSFAVVSAVAFAPTHLRWRYLCAISILLVPTGAEVFGVSLYAGFWGTVLAFIPLLWQVTTDRLAVRLLLLTVGSLSTPMIMGLSPLYVWRAYKLRHRVDAIVAAAALVLSVAQVGALIATRLTPHEYPNDLSVTAILEKWLGNFLIWREDLATGPLFLIAGLAITSLLAAFVWTERRDLDFGTWLLLATFAMTVLSCIIRIPTGVHPVYAGPRYFFLPYTLLSWILIQIAATRRVGAAVALVMLGLCWRNTMDIAPMHHRTLRWRHNVRVCIQSESLAVPIHYDGNIEDVWWVSLRGEDCRHLVEASLFDNRIP
jgi:hypothetical protein